jgi:DNA ligase (NAD+)
MKVAYKVQSEGDWTTVVSIEPRATRTGFVIPQVTVEPVHVGGVVITSVAGSNYTILNEKGIRKGSHVLVVKSKEVIPFIQEVDNEGVDTLTVPVPTECPSCGSTLTCGDRTLNCVNPECPAKLQGQVEHFLTTIGVKNHGKNRVAKLGVETIYDLYNLSIADILSIEGFKMTLAQSFYNQIRNCINPIEEWVLLEAICPRHIGEKTAKLITETIPIAELFNTDSDPRPRLRTIKGIGPERMNGPVSSRCSGNMDCRPLVLPFSTLQLPKGEK